MNAILPSVLQGFPNPVWMSDPQGLCNYFNAAWLAFTGRSLDQELGAGWAEGVHPADYQLCLDTYWRHFAAREPFDMEYRLRHHSGEYRWIRDYGAPRYDEGGAFAGYVGSCYDINDRKVFEDQKEIFETVFNSSPLGFILTDAKGLIQSVNGAFENLTGFSTLDAVGQTPRILKSGKYSSEYYQDMWTCIRSGRTWRDELVNRRKDGSSFRARLIIAPIRDNTGQITHYFGVQEDVTELRTAEERLRQSEKMEALGQLTSGVAHDFNNFLTVILGNCDMLAAGLADDPVHYRMAEMSRQAAARAATLTARLLEFSRARELRPRAFDINELVRDMQEMVVRTIEGGITLNVSLADDLPLAFADAGQCETALLNLVVNARDAMDAGGTLTIETAIADQDHPPGASVMLAVRDTGAGMTPEVLKRAFDPFFTTKPLGKGTGLGLAMVCGFVEQSGGFIDTTSEPGIGTTVRLYLPTAVARKPR